MSQLERIADRASRRPVWTAVLPPSSNTAHGAWQAIESISQAVFDRDYPPPLRSRRQPCSHDDSLLFAYLALASHDSKWTARAEERLNAAIDLAPRLKYSPGLYGGLCGLGWTIQHISRILDVTTACESDDGTVDEDLYREIDAGVLRALGQCEPWRGHYDLIWGLVGFGVYFLERMPSDAAFRGIRLVADHLNRICERTPDGVTWYSGPELLPAWQRRLCPFGYYNLGVAHGVPGIVYFLSEAVAANVDADRCSELLEAAVRWLLANQRPDESLPRFSAWFAPGQSWDSRLSWCYGDLGILTVLLQAANRMQRKDWLGFSHQLLNNCLTWPLESTGVKDVPLCHGAAGIAHIFNRIYHTVGDVRCREAAILWFERALAMRQPGTGVGGYTARTLPDRDGPPVWEPSPAFLDGAIGIALALISAVTPTEPHWDRLMALSGRNSVVD
jgi:hypothetical protein